MELRHLRYFVAVAEELHFRRAAERLHVAQPAVSEQVRKLEEELGVRLFERTQRSVSLTAAGTAMLEEARRVLRQAEIAMMAARNARDRATSVLRVGYLADSLPGSLPRALQQLSDTVPQVEVRLETASARRLVEGVRERRLDAAIVGLPAPTAGLRVASLGHQRAVAALPVAHPRAVDSALRLERLAPDRLVVLPRETNPAFHNAVVSICRDAGLTSTLVEVAEPRVELALLAVSSGAGIALLPDSVTERFASTSIRFLPLEGVGPAFENAAVTHPDSDSIATRAFLRALSRSAQLTPLAPARPSISLAA
jgi:DNA-binding transcriptional LysR family regulator